MSHLPASDLPLSGLRVLDFSQFLAGPACALRLADLGAEVTKIERPGTGDACRAMAPADQWLGDDSLLFHTINRNKKSLTANLKNPDDLCAVKAMLAQADVMIHNFRPGVMERIGLGFEDVQGLNPGIVYGVVSGYGATGPWKDLPGQDLLVQARSGMVWLTGSAGQDPTPMGASVVDMAAGMHLTQGILAALLRKMRSGKGGLVEVSLLASAMDLQFEQFTAYLNGDGAMPERSAVSGANVNAAAPYGLYETADGYVVIAMAAIEVLKDLLGIDALADFADDRRAYTHRDEIKAILRAALQVHTTQDVLDQLEPAGVWCAKVMDWTDLQASDALNAIEAVQTLSGPSGQSMQTTTCPIRLDGRSIQARGLAPTLGAQGHVSAQHQEKANT